MRIREIVIKAAVRENIEAVFVANRPIPLKEAENIEFILVEQGDDSADDYIVSSSIPGDMVITRDILMAGRLVEKKILVINDRGGIFTKENIGERISIRNFMKDLRDIGVYKREDVFDNRDIFAFAATFDRELRKLLINIPPVPDANG